MVHWQPPISLPFAAGFAVMLSKHKSSIAGSLLATILFDVVFPA